jgi:hypothetical protein
MAITDSQNYTNEQYSSPDFEKDEDLEKVVADAIGHLAPDLKDIIHQRYWENLTLKQIATYNNNSTTEVKSRIRQAHAFLRPLLIDYVASRWHFKPRGYCLVCRHQKRSIIDSLLRQKPAMQTWGEFGRILEIAIGEKINPPRYLIVHLSHIQSRGEQK